MKRTGNSQAFGMIQPSLPTLHRLGMTGSTFQMHRAENKEFQNNNAYNGLAFEKLRDIYLDYGKIIPILWGG
jgi:hypothetical protein